QRPWASPVGTQSGWNGLVLLSTSPTNALHLSCPHSHSAIEVVDSSPTSATPPSFRSPRSARRTTSPPCERVRRAPAVGLRQRRRHGQTLASGLLHGLRFAVTAD